MFVTAGGAECQKKTEPRAAENTTTDTRCHFAPIAGSARNRAALRAAIYALPSPCQQAWDRRAFGPLHKPFRWGAALEAGAALRGSRLAARAAHVMAPVADVSTVVESMGGCLSSALESAGS